MPKTLDKLFSRTLETLSAPSALVAPHFEKALATADFPPEYSIKVINEEDRIIDGFFHPSSDLIQGELFLFYKHNPKYQLVEERPTPDLLMTFQIGSAYHSLIQSMFIHLGFVKPEDVEHHFLDESKWISGHVDVRWFTTPTGDRFPVEIKTTSRLPDEPLPGHAEQVSVYADLACDKTPYGVLFYVEKSYPHRTKEFVIQRDDELLNGIYNKFRRVREAIHFDDPSMLRDCCIRDSKIHLSCPARLTCRIGRPS